MISVHSISPFFLEVEKCSIAGNLSGNCYFSKRDVYLESSVKGYLKSKNNYLKSWNGYVNLKFAFLNC